MIRQVVPELTLNPCPILDNSMAIRQVVLIECEGSHATPKMRIKQSYQAIHVSQVGKGEQVWLDLYEGLQATSHELQVGLTPFPATQASHFRVRKEGSETTLPTTAEVIHVAA